MGRGQIYRFIALQDNLIKSYRKSIAKILSIISLEEIISILGIKTNIQKK